MKKRLLFALASILMLGVLNSCNKDDESEKLIVTSGSTQQTVFADADKGTSAISFETSGAWTSSITEDSGTRSDETRANVMWIRISPSSGSSAGIYTINITLDTNYTGADRTAKVTITGSSKRITISLIQKSITESGARPVQEVKVTGVSLNKNATTLIEGDTETLVATVAPATATNKNVTWQSSAPAIATVDATGKVTAVKAGTTTITATTEDGAKTVTCNLTVNAATIAVTGINLNKSSLTLIAGVSETLTATVTPATATNKNVTWQSSAPAIATVDATGKVTAVKAGTTTITATTEDGAKTATCNLTVNAATVAVTGVNLNKSSLSLVEGVSETLIAIVAPSNATNKNVTWKSSAPAVATVNADGKVTALKTGTATITATTEDGSREATCSLTVNASSVNSGGNSDDWGNGGKINL